MNKKNVAIIIFICIVLVAYWVNHLLSPQVGFFGLDGYDYVGLVDVAPSGLSDIHLRIELTTDKKISNLRVREARGAVWVYPKNAVEMPAVIFQNKNLVDVFIEPYSPYARSIYFVTISYTDGQTAYSTIIP